MAEASEIAIHIRSLAALASGGRMRVLRSLQERRRTASEVAELLGMRRGSAQRHLIGLTHAGFAQRHEDSDRVWVYYSLTRQGRHLVESERPRLVLVLASTIAALAVVVGVVAWQWRQYTRTYGGAWSGQHIHNPPTFLSVTIVTLLALALALVIASAWSALRLRRAPNASYG
jgi:DNA-binding transcriptional ArsR family regulator